MRRSDVANSWPHSRNTSRKHQYGSCSGVMNNLGPGFVTTHIINKRGIRVARRNQVGSGPILNIRGILNVCADNPPVMPRYPFPLAILVDGVMKGACGYSNSKRGARWTPPNSTRGSTPNFIFERFSNIFGNSRNYLFVKFILLALEKLVGLFCYPLNAHLNRGNFKHDRRLT